MPLGDPLRRRFGSDDILLESFERIFEMVRRGQKFASEQEFLGVLLSIGAGQLRRHHRSLVTCAKRSQLREEDFELAKHDKPTAEAGPAEKAATTDECRQLLAQLTEEERAVLSAIQAGKPMTAIAERLGKSVRTIERIVQRARERLRAEFGA